MSFAVAILGLAVLILIHEAGHFYVARAVGMRPRKFYLGFPPSVVRVHRKGIEYGIGAIPLGGYVKIPGMHRPAPSDVDVHLGRAVEEAQALGAPAERLKTELGEGRMEAAAALLPELETAVDGAELSPAAARAARKGVGEIRDGLGDDAYWRQRTWKKVAVIFAGPATNLVFAILLLAVVYMLGVPTEATRTVESVRPDSPAAGVGLRPGDEIVAVNGRQVTPDRISATIRGSGGAPLRLTVRRGGRATELPPAAAEEIEGARRLGFSLEARIVHYGPLTALRLATETTWNATRAIGAALTRLVRGENREELSSAVGITQVSSQAVEAGFSVYLQVLALISLSLALLNLLPLLPLDGGHIAFSIVEGLRGRAIGREVYERVSFVGLAFVLFLFAVGLSNDIGRISGG
jgi:regulator of sigma E protease